MNEDRRMATDPQFIAFLSGFFDQKDLTSTMGLMARLRKQALESSEFVEALDAGDRSLEVSVAQVVCVG